MFMFVLFNAPGVSLVFPRKTTVTQHFLHTKQNTCSLMKTNKDKLKENVISDVGGHLEGGGGGVTGATRQSSSPDSVKQPSYTCNPG